MLKQDITIEADDMLAHEIVDVMSDLYFLLQTAQNIADRMERRIKEHS